MKRVKFEEGKTYGGWNHGRNLTITKRTDCYVWFDGMKKEVRRVRIDDEISEYVVLYDGHKVYASCEL